MTEKENKTVNIKLDLETKSKLKTLAFINDSSIQDLCKKAIIKLVNDNAEHIAKVESVKKS